jgi:predicted regulator of Ras-like GTPase activity (Roadblock/LC7/MglB family)
MTRGAAARGLNWLVEGFASAAPGVRYALVLSSDGFPLGGSPSLDAGSADHLAALAAGAQSLARGASHRFSGGSVHQTLIEMDEALLFITPVGDSACLAVLADSDADAGLIAYEMAVLVKRVGEHMGAKPRFPARDTASG